MFINKHFDVTAYNKTDFPQTLHMFYLTTISQLTLLKYKQ